jgi:hypothetical protein
MKEVALHPAPDFAAPQYKRSYGSKACYETWNATMRLDNATEQICFDFDDEDLQGKTSNG